MITPVVFLKRCIVAQDVALAFGEHETIQYTKCPLTGVWRGVKGDKNAYCFYPAGVGETT